MQCHFEDIGVYCIPTPNPFPVPDANVMLHKGDALTLFDAGTRTEEAYQILQAGLREVGIQICDLDQIILTHHHLDHIGLSRRLRDESGARVWAHPNASEQIPYMFDDTLTRAHLEGLLKTLGAPPAIMEAVIRGRHQYRDLLDEFVIDAAVEDGVGPGPFEAYFRPGHSATDVVYVHRTHRWAITGDHLIEKVTPNPLLRRCPEKGKRERSLVQYRDSVIETGKLALDWCFPGHGPPFRHHDAVVAATLQHIDRRGTKVLNAMPETGATPYEITRRLFPRLSEPQLYYCLSVATGHLELLEEQGLVAGEKHDDTLYYRRK